MTLLWHSCSTAVTLLWYCCDTAVTLLWHCWYIAVVLLWHCCGTAVTLLWYCCDTAVALLWHCGTAVTLPWYYCDTAPSVIRMVKGVHPEFSWNLIAKSWFCSSVGTTWLCSTRLNSNNRRKQVYMLHTRSISWFSDHIIQWQQVKSRKMQIWLLIGQSVQFKILKLIC